MVPAPVRETRLRLAELRFVGVFPDLCCRRHLVPARLSKLAPRLLVHADKIAVLGGSQKRHDPPAIIVIPPAWGVFALESVVGALANEEIGLRSNVKKIDERRERVRDPPEVQVSFKIRLPRELIGNPLGDVLSAQTVAIDWSLHRYFLTCKGSSLIRVLPHSGQNPCATKRM